ncbi:formate dehydrogenase accessory sulfurtransferase FdhD [Pedobacter sp. MR2016-19]|uniref:formate dehydrogenase accessory sulfurtransferase FdhD n=1 Tax=Pedobacter sp. MR2016-19 TaxID=2780089 RepID=UPI0018763858|nr:formate dehydrogenase accessory sulfurtransferase FdhD [Pedobacter sp. MR2016-19]MBE5318793.1 formate dehydrogenase accessory sulfurtransferase FdhD [Pedobacter sp. MR2016-19]
MIDIPSLSIRQIPVKKVSCAIAAPALDTLSVEEPLEIRIIYGAENNRVQKNISVTMRTPGEDLELALGFLFTEGIISAKDQVKNISHLAMPCELNKENIVGVELSEGFIPDLLQSDRNFYTTSSCGVCGKGSIAAIRTVSSYSNSADQEEMTLLPEVLYSLPDQLRAAQQNFAVTGGIHASGLFTMEGELLLLREDVGRHNALDKLIGAALAGDLLPLNQRILLLSGRASFELIQKAAMAGISIVAAIGAPSSLAVELASEFGITLLGFLREDRFNIYTTNERILIPISHEN